MSIRGRSRVGAPVLLLLFGLVLSQVVGAAPAQAAPPGAFGKTAPSNGATGQLLNVTLSWGTSDGATSYEYCYDTSTGCEGWVSVGTNTSVGISGLAANTTYHWQVRAVATGEYTYADGAYWQFTTGQAPGAFTKATPTTGATGQPLSVTLAWNGATMSPPGAYEYCYATTTGCTNWQSVASATSVVISGLSLNTTYWWQVRAGNAFGYTLADGGTYWGFTTLSQPASFGKAAPPNNAIGQPVSVTLSWGTSAGATSYEYCYDTTDNDACASYVSTGTATSVLVSGLASNTAYYWHVRAQPASVYSDGGATAFWKFTTGLLPGSFSKSSPANGATGQAVNLTLSWGTSSMSPAGYYEYCYDTTNDSLCSTWTSTGTSRSVVIAGLSANTTYYWHVRAVNTVGTTYSDGGATAFWRFTTSSPPGAFGKVAPANYATGQPLNVTLSWGTSVMSPAGSYQYCYDTTNDDLCSPWTSTGTSRSVVIAGLSANTTYYWHVRAVNTAGTTYSDGGAYAYWMFTTGSGTPGTMLFRSLGAYDGWVRESGETSGVGGAVNSTATTCRVGDDLADRQYRSVLDFRTSRLPDNAIITRVVLKFKPSSVVGSNPFLTHGNLRVDIRNGAFGNALALQTADFQAPANTPRVGVFRSTPVASGQYRAIIGAAGYASVNLRGHTQFRLRFTVDDNDDRGADYLAFLCGNSALLRDRPVLVVTYRLP